MAASVREQMGREEEELSAFLAAPIRDEHGTVYRPLPPARGLHQSITLVPIQEVSPAPCTGDGGPRCPCTLVPRCGTQVPRCGPPAGDSPPGITTSSPRSATPSILPSTLICLIICPTISYLSSLEYVGCVQGGEVADLREDFTLGGQGSLAEREAALQAIQGDRVREAQLRRYNHKD